MFRRGHGFGRRPYGGRGYGQRAMLMMLVMQLLGQIQRLPIKPPVTLGLMALQSAMYFAPATFRVDRSLTKLCLSPAPIVAGGQLYRLVVSAFLHADEWHLYYNMASLLWKGVALEQALGSVEFSAMTAMMLFLTHLLYVGASFFVPSLWTSCAVGFSGVLFALKVVLNARSPAYTSLWGIQLPTKYAAWAELVLISLITPHASFAGHLCGILAGYIYLYGLGDVVHRAVRESLGSDMGIPPGSSGQPHRPATEPIPLRRSNFFGMGRVGGAGMRNVSGGGGGGGGPVVGDGGWVGSEAMNGLDGDAALARRLQAEEDARA